MSFDAAANADMVKSALGDVNSIIMQVCGLRGVRSSKQRRNHSLAPAFFLTTFCISFPLISDVLHYVIQESGSEDNLL